MKYRITEIKTDIDMPADALPGIVAKRVGISESDISGWELRRKSIDSRKKPHIQFVYTVEFVTDRRLNPKKISNLNIVDEEAEAASIRAPEPGGEILHGRPVVVGAGPAGLFAAMELAAHGYKPILIERGPSMEERVAAVDKFREEGVLNPEANMLFGEGGAGTFSDGKLTTGIKDGLIRKVLREFVDAGAGDEIMYLAKPHIGTDVLRSVIVNIRKKIGELGGEIRFNTRLESFEIKDGGLCAVRTVNVRTGDADYIETNALVLAIGHSARDTFEMIRDAGASMQQKAFSIGVRMEHPQELIDAAQYGAENMGKLPPADYKINYKASNGRGVYSFCMCPGGEVVVCSTKDGELCVNGMSERKRDSGFANSGILCDVRTDDFGSDDVLAGVRFQEKYERLAFENGGRNFSPPSCRMADFLEKSEGSKSVEASLPEFAAAAIREAVPAFARKIKGYDSPEARVLATETRSSSPVRILRNEEGVSSISGIYPCGEGAGYAGGITSAACDGIRTAHHIIEKFAPIAKDYGNAHAK
ncbi:MAG: FAD-dependent oxidoreductase [Mogibacterium sp.]|nr:FAD-dependent oxidoreductase [Mogibacterium sp.]